MLVELSECHAFQGDRITLAGRRFEGGTTDNFWRDADGDGETDPGEAVLCSVIATSRDIGKSTITVAVPPFSGVPESRATETTSMGTVRI